MDIGKSLIFLRDYTKNNIEGYYQQYDDFGVRALILLVQDRFKFYLGINTNQNNQSSDRKIKDLRDAIEVCYKREDFIEFAEKYYISDVLLSKPIDVEWYVNELEDYNLKIVEKKPLTLDDKYTVTHIVWGLYMIGRENAILRHYKDFLSDVLVNLYSKTKPSDIQTETLYFLSLIDKSRVKEDWIIRLEQGQEQDGGFSGEEDVMRAHHTALALLTIYNYYNL
tara:strand:- start:53 stop:724 length:672 start_codon:yes stop_codon:yes gene_type:complete